MTNSAGYVASVAVSVVALSWILFRQVRVREVRTGRILPIALIVIGVGDLVAPGLGSALSTRSMTVLAVVLAGDAVGLGALRSFTVQIWRENGVIVRRGSHVTVMLWLVGLAIHATVDLTVLAGTSTLLLYLGITWLAQRLVLEARAHRINLAP